MEKYECKLCKYETCNLSNYRKHLKTKKHKNREEELGVEMKNTIKKEQKTDKKRTLVEKKGQKTDSKRTISSKKLLNICKYCEKEFSSRQTLLRHEKKYCKQKEDLTTKLDIQAEIIERLEEEKREYKKEKEKLYKQIEELIKMILQFLIIKLIQI